MICFHHNDLDGRCAAAIVNLFYNREMLHCPEAPLIEYIEVDYKDKIAVERIPENSRVYIVDFSFKPEVMENILKRTNKVIWIDHHVTAKDYPYQDLKGLRDFTDKGASGCELTWDYFFSGSIIKWRGADIPMRVPDAIRLIGDYDSWRLSEPEKCFAFYEGMKLEDSSPTGRTWWELFTGQLSTSFIIKQGNMAIKYRDNYCEGVRKSFGYETELDGHKMYATNFYMFGSKGFGDKFNQYDACLAYIHDGEKFTVSLYSEKIDVSVIAKKYGGGGHKGAAGFICDTLPWGKGGCT